MDSLNKRICSYLNPIKNYLLLLGIVLTILSQFVSNIDQHPFLHRIIVPEYFNALMITEKVDSSDGTKDYELSSGDEGFDLLEEFLSTNFKDQNGKPLGERLKELNSSINKIKLLLQIKAGMSLGGLGAGPQGAALIAPNTNLSIECIDKNGRKDTTTTTVPNFSKQLLNYSLGDRLNLVTGILFWLGTVLNIVVLFIDWEASALKKYKNK